MNKQAKQDQLQATSVWVEHNLPYGISRSSEYLYTSFIHYLIECNVSVEDQPTLRAFRSRLEKMDFIESSKEKRKSDGHIINKYRKVSVQKQKEDACNCLCALGKKAAKLLSRVR